MRIRPHSGQALVVMLAFLTCLSGAFVLVFNVGQVVNDKIKLTNAADAAAYSAALWEARSLNFQAYLNRAMVANEVATAQLVSLRSWSQYIGRLTTNADQVTRYIPPLAGPMRALAQGWGGINTECRARCPSWSLHSVCGIRRRLSQPRRSLISRHCLWLRIWSRKSALPMNHGRRFRMPPRLLQVQMARSGSTALPQGISAAAAICAASRSC